MNPVVLNECSLKIEQLYLDNFSDNKAGCPAKSACIAPGWLSDYQCKRIYLTSYSALLLLFIDAVNQVCDKCNPQFLFHSLHMIQRHHNRQNSFRRKQP